MDRGKPPSAQQRVRLAVIAALEKKPGDFAAFLRLMEESGFAVKHGRGGVISFLAPGQDKPTRLRASTLGAGFDPEDIQAVIAGERPILSSPGRSGPPRRVDLVIDIQQRMAQGKGPAYARWAKVYNLKQMAAALQYLREHELADYAALEASTEAAVDRFHKLAGELRGYGGRPSPKRPGLWRPRWTMPRPGLCSMATRRPGTVKNTWPSMRRSWPLIGRQRRP